MGLGTTEYVHIIRSGYSSRIFEMRRVPIPAPVPPPRECVIWKPTRRRRRQKWNQTRDTRVHRVSDAYQHTLKSISTLSLLPNDIEDGINEFGTLRVVCGCVSKNVFEKNDMPHGCCFTHVLLPSCYLHHSDRRQSCLGGKGHREDPTERHPWFRARDQLRSREEHTCWRQSRYSRQRSVRAEGHCCLCKGRHVRSRVRLKRPPRI